MQSLVSALTVDRPILVVEAPKPLKIIPATFGINDVSTPVETDIVTFAVSPETWERWETQFGIEIIEQFACHSAACRPPTSGGTGGSIDATASKGVSPSTHLDLLFPGRRDAKNKTVNPDGTFSVEGLDKDGNPTRFAASTEAKVKAEWDAIGPSEEQYVANFVIGGKIAMGIDPATGHVNAAVANAGHLDSKWYTVAHEDTVAIAEKTGIPLDNVVAATTTLSAGRLWSGTANGNIETARALADIVKNPIDIEVTQAHIDFMNFRGEKSTKGVGRIGLLDHNLKPGKINSADLNSATLVETLYALNTMRGHSSLQDWMEKTSKDGKVGMKASKEQMSSPPPFPFFTSKGTQQVKQAVAVLRNEVTPRQAISGPKYSSFYSNIRNPNANYSTTNDTWHYRIMAGNLPITYTAKGVTKTDTIDRLSMKERSPDGKVHGTTQDIFQSGPASKKEGLSSGDVMFRDVTVMTKKALAQLAAEHPTQFGTMKPHEFQALIWVAYGGGQSGKSERLKRWDDAREAMRKAGV